MNIDRWLRLDRITVIIAALSIVALALAVGLWLALTREGGEAGRTQRPASQEGSRADAQAVVWVEPEDQTRSGIEVAPAAAAMGTEQLRAYATVLDPVRLTELTNSAAAARAQLTAAQAKLAASKAAVERTKALYRADQNVSLAALQTAQAAYDADEAAVATARAQSEASEAIEQQEFGSELNGQPELSTALTTRRSVLLQVTVPPGVWLATRPASLELQGDAGQRTEARFVSNATHTDPKIQGQSMLYVAPANEWLLPGANVMAVIAGDPRRGVIVPATAVVSWQGRIWTYVKTGAETFRRVAVPQDVPAADGGWIMPDLPAGSPIVVKGAELLLSQELRPLPQSAGGNND
ncbi:MAG: multidrug transporter [Rhodospirillales bacterium]|nr:multidrug transporter [Rhodospirillales bacterium]